MNQSPIKKPPRNIRTEFALGVAALTLCIAVAIVPSCGSTPPQIPTEDEINEQYDERLDALERAKQQMLKDCDGDAACRQGVLTWHQEMFQLLETMRDKAIQQHWQEAYDLRKEWEEKFRDMLPDFPNINDIIAPYLVDASLTFDITIEDDDDGGPDPCEEVVRMVEAFESDYDTINLALVENATLRFMVQRSPCFAIVTQPQGEEIAYALESANWSLSGTIDIALGGSVFQATIAGVLSLAPDAPENSDDWEIVAGELTLSVGTETIGVMEVVWDLGNRVTVHGDGSGTLDVLLYAEYESIAWAAVLPGHIRLQLPISDVSNDEVLIDAQSNPASDLIPYVLWPASDYNDDGILDYDTDFAAFLVGFYDEELLADSNSDGIWDQDDIDLWMDRFWTDYQAVQE